MSLITGLSLLLLALTMGAALAGTASIPCQDCPDTKAGWAVNTIGHASCVMEGFITYQCGNCGSIRTENTGIDPDSHYRVHPYLSVKATCVSEGKSGYSYCSACRKQYYELAGEMHYFQWSDELPSIPIDPNNHVNLISYPQTATCTAGGHLAYSQCADCGVLLDEAMKTIQKVPQCGPLGHIPAESAAATCTRPGITGETACTRCGESLPPQTIPALGHLERTDPGRPATCTENGLTDGSYCLRCGQEIDRKIIIAALGHRFGEYVPNNDAACQQDGTKTARCQREGCQETDTRRDINSALSHVFTDYVSNHDASCDQDGTKTALCGNGCGRASTVADEGTALGHSFIAYRSNNDASCDRDGTKTALCDRGCGKADIQPDPGTALSHLWGPWRSAVPGRHGTDCGRCDHTRYASCQIISRLLKDHEISLCPVCGAGDENLAAEKIRGVNVRGALGGVPAVWTAEAEGALFLTLALVEASGRLARQTDSLEISLPAVLLEGKTLVMLDENGETAEISFTLNGDLAVFTLDFSALGSDALPAFVLAAV